MKSTYVVKSTYVDCCGHGQENFLGQAERFLNATTVEVLDVYLYRSVQTLDVCLRYGNEPHEYYSPGNVLCFLQNKYGTGSSPIYGEQAYQLVTKRLWKLLGMGELP